MTHKKLTDLLNGNNTPQNDKEPLGKIGLDNYYSFFVYKKIPFFSLDLTKKNSYAFILSIDDSGNGSYGSINENGITVSIFKKEYSEAHSFFKINDTWESKNLYGNKRKDLNEKLKEDYIERLDKVLEFYNSQTKSI